LSEETDATNASPAPQMMIPGVRKSTAASPKVISLSSLVVPSKMKINKVLISASPAILPWGRNLDRPHFGCRAALLLYRGYLKPRKALEVEGEESSIEL